MVNYICLRCNYNTDRKSNFINHLSRKKICKVSKTDVTINYMMDVYNLSDCKKIKKIKKKSVLNALVVIKTSIGKIIWKDIQIRV